MKLKLLSMVILLSGCTTGYLYDGQVAPVRNENTYVGRANSNPNRQPVQIRENTYAQELERQRAEAQRQQVKVEEPRKVSSDDSWDVKPQEPKVNTPSPSKAATTKKDEPPTISDEPKFERVKNTPAKTAEKTVAENKTPTVKREEPKKEESSAPTREIARVEPKREKAPSQVDTLINKANSELQKGNLESAVSYLTDASNLNKKNPNILYDIANIRYHQGKYREAESAASQAIRVGGGNKDMQKKIWSLIANSRDKSGDKSGAKAAADKAASL